MSQSQRIVRQKIFRILGGRCQSPTCRWLNADGTLGCTVWQMLQIDHVRGGGSQSRVKGSPTNYLPILRALQDGSTDYQLLCANCNWLKRYENREARGAVKQVPDRVESPKPLFDAL